MKRVNNLFEKIISDENLYLAIEEVNLHHHWHKNHTPNRCTAWVEFTKADRVKDLRKIIIEGFEPQEPRVTKRYDVSARKWRIINEPKQWPDQYVHHALIQVTQPVLMRGMDMYCCGSIKGRGTRLAKEAIEHWVRHDIPGTKYELVADIHHFYDSLKSEVVVNRMKELIKDYRTLDLIERIVRDGVKIGYYTSQWFANTVLQPLDMTIRQSGLCKKYVRYIDNFSIFGPNKRKLFKLKLLIDEWLAEKDLELKHDWQIFRIPSKDKERIPLKPPRRGIERTFTRLPSAVGYTFGRTYTIPRKHNYFRLKNQIERYRIRRDAGRITTPHQARGMLSRIGMLRHCNNTSVYQYLYHGERIERELKQIDRQAKRKESLTWNMYLEQRAQKKLCSQKATSTQT